MLTALYNTQIVSAGAVCRGKAVIISGGHIIEIVAESDIPAGAQKIDLKGAFVAPGFIDLQIYGAGKSLFGSLPSVAALQDMENALLNEGCTGFFATVATNSNNVVFDAIEAAKQWRPHSNGNFLGLHLEGPYINPKRKGAHPEEYIKKSTLTEIEEWVNRAEGEIKMITLAPELQDEEVIKYLNAQGIILSSGHSNATYRQAKRFLNKTINAVTHLYNAMPPIHHREPGIIPAIFEERPYTSIVADGIHVDYAMVRLAKRELGNKLFFITDAVTEAKTGTYQHIRQGNKYTMPDGTLSGSALTMLKAVQNGVEHAGFELAEAVNMASLYPAQLAGLATKGKVEAGYDADLIIFDAGFNTAFTIYKGKVHQKNNQPLI
ncbi:N-acetylglucosamine-6-phosphate deacetylase [Mucilaginibacter aquatilis]|uniref:N-acetylglucosamine-6-phosphate deacetylase n=1 Tax=Mucilaginibacter aquatilis TaxID=1517760 RepID=A0A6I4IE79_9SPHI|nr:N-acetylglucosamine-6-phosphate deacetylase [Mucilaginibacter aquatilis]MVN92098.1 N-acetylglucosamine-6-phosphate deacetylase [Mucilaginibacter aquatilis]